MFNAAQNGPGGLAKLLLLFSFTGVNGIFEPAKRPEELDDPQAGTTLTLPSNWIADFRRLYDFSSAGHSDLAAPPGGGNLAKRLDTRLVDPLAELPLGSFDGRPPKPRPAPIERAWRSATCCAPTWSASRVGSRWPASSGLTISRSRR